MRNRAFGALPYRLLPRRLRHPWNLPLQRKLAEAQAAYAELAQKRARPPAPLAAVVPARRKLRSLPLVIPRRFKLLLDLRVLNSFRCSHAILKNSSYRNLNL
jgi:hypothetical protein